jgi:hypothetical protein
MALGMQLKRIWRRIWSPSLKRRRRQNRAIVVAVALLLPAGIAALAINWNVIVTEAALAAARENPTALRNFLYRMPKGGDLHVHLSGGVYAERYIGWAAADGLSLLVCNMTIVKLPLDKPPPSEPFVSGGARENASSWIASIQPVPPSSARWPRATRCLTI